MLGQIIPRLKPREPLLSFERVQAVLRSRNYAFKGLQNIPLAAIVGSEGRSRDLGRDLRPLTSRWERARELPDPGQEPPIWVFQMDQVYFVRDGHHRLARARATGQRWIWALVTQISVRTEMSPSMGNQEMLLQAQWSHFLQETNLDQHAPQSNFRLRPPELYASLRQHIEVHRYYLGLEHQRDFSLSQAAASWHDCIYQPALVGLQQAGALQEFPRRSPAELYLWLTYHREEDRARGHDHSDLEVAKALVQRFSDHPLRGWVRRLQRIWSAAWRAAQERPEPPCDLGRTQAQATTD